ncbi:transposable element Tc1 transposase [Trichonephila clavipes]|nr:transposable element Tc1 transposase [Trichonephila clavipes]
MVILNHGQVKWTTPELAHPSPNFHIAPTEERLSLERFNTREGTHARKTGSGATRKTTRREDRRIVRQALVDPTVTRSKIRADVGVAIVPQTISRHLADANLKSKRPFRALPLTPENRQLRLQWCQARSMWNVTDWQKVVFSDESRFVFGTDDNRVRVWRRPGERYNSPHTVTLPTQLV